jgi:hypothetical protein
MMYEPSEIAARESRACELRCIRSAVNYNNPGQNNASDIFTACQHCNVSSLELHNFRPPLCDFLEADRLLVTATVRETESMHVRHFCKLEFSGNANLFTAILAVCGYSGRFGCIWLYSHMAVLAVSGYSGACPSTILWNDKLSTGSISTQLIRFFLKCGTAAENMREACPNTTCYYHTNVDTLTVSCGVYPS